VLLQWPLLAIIVLSGTGAILVALLALRDLRATSIVAAEPDEERSPTLPRLGYAAVAACFTVVTLLAVVAAVRRSPTNPAEWSTSIPAARLEQRVADVEARLDALGERLASVAERAGDTESRVAGTQARSTAAVDRVSSLEARITSLENHATAARFRATTSTARAAPRPRPPAAVDAPRRSSRSGPASTAPEPDPATPPSPRAAGETRPLTGGRTAERNVGGTPSRPPDRSWQTGRDAGPSRGFEAPLTSRPRPSPTSELGARLRQDWEAIKRDTRAGGRELQDAWQKLRGLFD
jgi:hypothetical protein